MPGIRYLKDKNDEVYYPMTHERAVRDSEGVTLQTKLRNSNALVSNLSIMADTLQSKVNALTGEEYIIAWDGSSTPDTASIPSGVVVQYNGNSYTGQMAASDSTERKIYLVSDGVSDNYNRYISTKTGGSYYWVFYGNTAIDLSDYIRKDSEVWLTQQEFEVLTIKDPNVTYNVYEEEDII